MILFDKIAAQLPNWQARMARLVSEFGARKVCEVNVEQIYTGMRGVHVQVSDISYVDPARGILFRGYTMKEVLTLLPKATGSDYPLAGGLYYLLMTGELPTHKNAVEVEEEWQKRSQIPAHVGAVLDALPAQTHPMAMFSHAILALQSESLFSTRYAEGMPKAEHWQATLEDSLNLTARLPGLAAAVFRRKYGKETLPQDSPDLDWSARFSSLSGLPAPKEYHDLLRLYFVLHADHEGANVSAHVSALVSSALSDVYYASSAAMNGLAGPLHGIANQDCLRWLLQLRSAFDAFPAPSQIESYCRGELAAGRLIPGYGHAVLRVTDPRFTALLEFGQKFLPDDELVRLASEVYAVLPGILAEQGKVKNPWPNVDAISGTLQYHYGIRECDFHTVLFGVSRILGLTTHAVWSRALRKPIERPKSMTTRMLEELVCAA